MTASLLGLTSRMPGAGESDESAARSLTAYFLRTMLAELRKSGGSSLLGGSSGASMFQDMLDEAMADAMADAGGLGMTDLFADPDPAPHEPGFDPLTAVPSPERSGVTPARPGAAELPLERPVNGRVSSSFGPRLHPIEGRVRAHRGIDLAAPAGAPVRAAAPGTVIRAERAGTYGNLIVIDHGGGATTRYAHLRDIDVAAGQRVEAGQAIGAVGATGAATGPHLHFELRRDGEAVDPETALPGLKAGPGGSIR